LGQNPVDAFDAFDRFRHCSLYRTGVQYLKHATAGQAVSPPTMSRTAPEPPRVGETLAALRQERSMSLDELSRQAGVSKSMLSQIERNQANPTVAVVWRLSNALGVPMAQLLEGAPRPAPPAIATVASQSTWRGSSSGTSSACSPAVRWSPRPMSRARGST
jgi:DNA-binding XRE family transcriptional regulator